MKIFAYLRASTKNQDATRAKETMANFLKDSNHIVADWFTENESGTKLHRPELMRLLENAEKGDVLFVEQVDRLTRLTADDWRQLKRAIEDKQIHLVSMDLPTSQLILKQDKKSLVDDILVHVNNLLLDILATTARKDYEDRRRRQAEGIKKAKESGKFKGRKQSEETIKKCQRALELSDSGSTKIEAAKAVGIGVATLYRYIKESNIKS